MAISQEECEKVITEVFSNSRFEKAKSVPRLKVIESEEFYCSITITEPSYLTVSTGLLDLCSQEDFRFIMGHEAEHLINRENSLRIGFTIDAIRVLMCIVLIELANFGIISNLIVLFLAGVAGSMATIYLEVWIRIKQEFYCDLVSAKLFGFKEGISLLEKLDSDQKLTDIANGSSFVSFISLNSHPPLSERIKKLKEKRMSRFT